LQPAALARRFRIAFYVRERSVAAKMSAGAFENAGNVRYDRDSSVVPEMRVRFRPAGFFLMQRSRTAAGFVSC
jgi:hypothetical protein